MGYCQISSRRSPDCTHPHSSPRNTQRKPRRGPHKGIDGGSLLYDNFKSRGHRPDLKFSRHSAFISEAFGEREWEQRDLVGLAGQLRKQPASKSSAGKQHASKIFFRCSRSSKGGVRVPIPATMPLLLDEYKRLNFDSFRGLDYPSTTDNSFHVCY